MDEKILFWCYIFPPFKVPRSQTHECVYHIVYECVYHIASWPLSNDVYNILAQRVTHPQVATAAPPR